MLIDLYAFCLIGRRRGVRAKMEQAFSYADLRIYRSKGWRNRNWQWLTEREKGLYMAAMWYAKGKGEIVNSFVVRKLMSIVEKLRATIKVRIFQAGLAKAAGMLAEDDKGVFKWAPRLREWLRDPDYILWLGICSFEARFSIVRTAER